MVTEPQSRYRRFLDPIVNPNEHNVLVRSQIRGAEKREPTNTTNKAKCRETRSRRETGSDGLLMVFRQEVGLGEPDGRLTQKTLLLFTECQFGNKATLLPSDASFVIAVTGTQMSD